MLRDHRDVSVRIIPRLLENGVQIACQRPDYVADGGQIKALTLTLSRRERGQRFIRQKLIDHRAQEIGGEQNR